MRLDESMASREYLFSTGIDVADSVESEHRLADSLSFGALDVFPPSMPSAFLFNVSYTDRGVPSMVLSCKDKADIWEMLCYDSIDKC